MQAKAQLGDSEAGAVSLGGSVVASHYRKGHAPLDTHDTLLLAAGVFFFGGADFFFATVRDVSGEHREPPWA